MVSPTDIITYVGIPLALLGVTPILYTYLSTAYTGYRLRRTFASYDIEASVYSRLLSGVVEADVPAYQLSIYPRSHDNYRRHKISAGAKHGASWDSFHWVRTPIEQTNLQIHSNDRLRLPEARIGFGELIMYLADWGLHTNADGFWALAQNGLHVLPGTVLVEKRIEGGLTHPILVVAKPTVEHPGTILLRFKPIPTECKRTDEDLEPFWIPVGPTPNYAIPPNCVAASVPATVEADSTSGGEKRKKESHPNTEKLPETKESTVIDTHLRISHKGIVERRLSNGKHLPVHGNAFWFAYALLGSCAGNSKLSYTGQPFGLKIRLENVYIARECVLPIELIPVSILPNLTMLGWSAFSRELLSPVKMRAVPVEWTEDSPARDDLRLIKRFEASMSDELRARARYFREQRQSAMEIARQGSKSEETCVYVPLEVLKVKSSLWREIAKHIADFSCMSPMSATRVPTCQEICVAAASNYELADHITAVLGDIFKYFREGTDCAYVSSTSTPKEKIVFLCAVIILQSIADNGPYLAALNDVQDCMGKWNPAYLC